MFIFPKRPPPYTFLACVPFLYQPSVSSQCHKQPVVNHFFKVMDVSLLNDQSDLAFCGIDMLHVFHDNSNVCLSDPRDPEGWGRLLQTDTEF